MPPATAGRSTTGAAANTARRHLLEVLSPVVESAGYDLEDLSVTAAGRRSLVRVSVDADGGIDLDAVAELSRAISAVLDADADGDPAFAGPYVLEVSSPGVQRPLTEQRHWRRAAGRLVEVSFSERTVRGRVLDTSASGVLLDIDGTETELAWSQLGPGHIQVEFNPPGAPGSTRSPGNRAREG